MFHRDDYPTADSLRNKFAFRVSYIPMPEAGDFRLDIGNEAQQQLKEQYENYFESRIKQATADVYQRCSDSITRLINSMDWAQGEKPKRMYQTTFDAVCELIDVMQAFNLTGDTTMEALRKQLATIMDGVNPGVYQGGPCPTGGEEGAARTCSEGSAEPGLVTTTNYAHA